MRKLIRKIIDWYKSSSLYNFIDKKISEYYKKRLKNENFSIICSNCIGGTVYHRFGEKFCSPTINMFIVNPDFVEFVTNIEYFLSVDPVFIESNNPFPTAVLPGVEGKIRSITLNFNHAETNEEAKEAWDKRKKRVNYNNLYLMMYNLDGLTLEDIRKVEKLPADKWKNKVIFTCEPLPDVDWSVYIKPVMTDSYPYSYLQKNFLGLRRFERKFDLIKFINKR